MSKVTAESIISEQMQEIIGDVINQYCYENKLIGTEVVINLDTFNVKDTDLFVIVRHNDNAFASVLMFNGQFVVTSYDEKVVLDGKSANNVH